MKITIIGAGNGGQAMAGHFSQLGHEITLYARNLSKIVELIDNEGVHLRGELFGFAPIHCFTDSIEEALSGAELVMICTTAIAHKDLARQMAPFLSENQHIVLNPGRTLGAFEFYQEVVKITNKKVFIAEAQSLIYACRAEEGAKVNVIGVKEKVLFAAFPSVNTTEMLTRLNSVFNCFVPVKSVLHTSLENIGAILHPAVIIFNAATIERGTTFYFYNDMTPKIANFLVKLDKERVQLGKLLDIELKSVADWISYAYDNIEGEGLCDKMRNNKAYYRIKAPTIIESRLLLEDVPTGILTLTEIGKLLGHEMPLMNAVLEMTMGLLDKDFRESGRTLENLGLKEINLKEFTNLFKSVHVG
jgi:opine dehydrogenase